MDDAQANLSTKWPSLNVLRGSKQEVGADCGTPGFEKLVSNPLPGMRATRTNSTTHIRCIEYATLYPSYMTIHQSNLSTDEGRKILGVKV
jgi:hypothetical protein